MKKVVKPKAGKKGADPGAGPAGKKKKKNVIEIDGQPWLCDDAGNPVKKLRKKPGKDDEGGPPPPDDEPDPEKPSSGKKKKKNVAEIDGQLYLLDENGRPLKKLRKKGEEGGGGGNLPRRKSEGHGLSRMQDATRRPEGHQAGSKIRRATSLGRVTEEADRRSREMDEVKSMPATRKEYIDTKGRRVIIEEDGTKTVIDKNGKKLRKKKKPEAAAPPAPAAPPEDISLGGGNGIFGDIPANSQHSGEGGGDMFDSLWDDGGGGKKSSKKNVSAKPSHNEDDEDEKDHADDVAKDSALSNSLSAKISEYGKENRELSLKVMAAEEEIRDLNELNKKEKAKNVKAMTEMMALKANFHEATSELRDLKLQLKDLQGMVDAKDKQIEALKEKDRENRGGGRAEAPPMRGYRGRHEDDGEEKKGEAGPHRCSSCGTPNPEGAALLEEKEKLQRKIEFDKTSSQQELKKKDDRIKFLSDENASLRDEIEMILKGEEGDGPKNPVMVRLLNEKKEIELKFIQEKEVSSVRFEAMQETIESSQQSNREMKRQLREMAEQLEAATGGANTAAPLLDGGKDPNNSEGSLEMDMNYMKQQGGGNLDNRIQGFGSTPQTQQEDMNASVSGGLWNAFRGRK